MSEWKWVPVEPTDAMVEHICAAHAGSGWPDDYGLTAQRNRRERARSGYASMLAAAPTPPAEAVTNAMVAVARDAHRAAMLATNGDRIAAMRAAIAAARAAKEGR